MADEINRASPRTQSALLQAMQEYHVTVAGERHDLPRPFHVLATQNPLEQEGTYPLPEAQLDRFLHADRRRLPRRVPPNARSCSRPPATRRVKPKQAHDADDLMAAQRLMRRLPVGESVVEAILELVRSARPGEAAMPGSPIISPGAPARARVRPSCWPARPRPHPGPPRALARRCARACRARAEASHGADLRARAEGETVDGLIHKLVSKIG